MEAPAPTAVRVRRRVRGTAEWEDWLGEDAEGRTVRVRRLLAERFRAPAGRAALQEIVHHAIALRPPQALGVLGFLEIEGEPALILEHLPGVSARALITHHTNITPAVAVWIAREIARAWAELEVERGHRAPALLDLDDLHFDAEGQVRLEAFALWVGPALGAGAGAGSAAGAIGAILEALTRASVQSVPQALTALLARCGPDGLLRDLRTLEDALSRVFYAELGGDDARDGHLALASLVKSAVAASSDEVDTNDSAGTEPPSVDSRPRGHLTRALESRDARVVPQPLSSDDYDVSSVRADPPSVRADAPSARADAPSVPSPAIAPNRPAHSPLVGPPAPPAALAQRPLPSPSSLSADEIKRTRPAVAALWFSLGFITALAVVATIQLVLQRREPPAVIEIGGGAPAAPIEPRAAPAQREASAEPR
ncbi:MAG: hypothetical protein IT384_07785 [Deltaproteobacteria bacterium]|nr:hypothetical protein [Deltaproteobacteria bacterium]